LCKTGVTVVKQLDK